MGCLQDISEGGGVLLAEGNDVVELLGVAAVDGVLKTGEEIDNFFGRLSVVALVVSYSNVVAGEGGLVEDGLVSAEEGPVEGLGDAAEVILDRQADVEHLGNKKKKTIIIIHG